MGNVIAIVGMGPGVSAAVARRFGREGFQVAALARRADALQAQVEALAASGVEARAYPADAAEPASLAAALARAAGELGGIDVLLYNAVGVHYKPLAQLTPAELAADLQTSVVGAFAAVQTVLPAMRARRGGSLLLTGGGFALEPTPMLASVGIGKAALRNLTMSLFADLKDSGVHAATLTIAGMVKPGTAFDPDAIAEHFWALHAQPQGSWEREVVFKG